MPADRRTATFVSPVVVVRHTFPARPGSLPDAEQFVAEALEPAALEPDESRALYEAINDAILAAAGPADGEFDVTVRIFPDGVEVEVLHGGGPDGDPRGRRRPVRRLADRRAQRQGLSQQAAARQIGVSVRTISRWVRGDTEPRLRDLRRVHAVFGPEK